MAFVAAAALTAFSAPAFADAKPGSSAPEFELTDIMGRSHKLSDFKGKHVVLEWTNPDCPFVKKHYETGNMQALQSEYVYKGVVWLTVNSSAEGKQGNYSPQEWNEIAKKWKHAGTTILLDPSGKAGKAYGAKTTPHIFVVNPEGKLVYKGAMDDKSGTDKAEVKDAKNYVRQALNESLAGKPVSTPATESYGCSVKY